MWREICGVRSQTPHVIRQTEAWVYLQSTFHFRHWFPFCRNEDYLHTNHRKERQPVCKPGMIDCQHSAHNDVAGVHRRGEDNVELQSLTCRQSHSAELNRRGPHTVPMTGDPYLNPMSQSSKHWCVQTG